jgi:hypothetical protein
MCGRAKLPDDVSEIKLDLKIDLDEIGDYRPRWNAAPTSKLPVVISENARRVLTLMRWGLVRPGPPTSRSAIRPSTPAPKVSPPALPFAAPGRPAAAALSSPTVIMSGAIPTSSRLQSRSPIAGR